MKSRRVNKVSGPGGPALKRYNCLFFDFDGVILDSVNIKTEAFKAIYRKYGEAVVRKVTAHHTANGGMSRFKKFKLYHERFLGKKTSKNQIDELAENYSDLVFKKVLKAGFIKGALEFLKLCRKRKKTIFLVSSTPDSEIKKIIQKRGLGKYFDSVKGSPRSKEKNIEDLLTKHKINRSRSVFFGDSINDLKAASWCNVKFIAINYPGCAGSYKNFKALMSGRRPQK